MRPIASPRPARARSRRAACKRVSSDRPSPSPDVRCAFAGAGGVLGRCSRNQLTERFASDGSVTPKAVRRRRAPFARRCSTNCSAVDGFGVVTWKSSFALQKGSPIDLRCWRANWLALQVDLIVVVGAVGAAAAKQAPPVDPRGICRGACAGGTGPGVQPGPAGRQPYGLSTQSDELIGKRLELLRRRFRAPPASRCWARVRRLQTELVNLAGAALGLQLLHTAAQHPRGAGLDGRRAVARRCLGFVNDGQLHFAHRKNIVTLIARQRKPAIYPLPIFVAEGGLMSYSVDQKEQFRRAGELVDRVLRGAKPADIPVEQPINSCWY